ncbi:MAG: hypothetical protein UR34_C0011G0018 [candidate division WS6 bacterium GW2011_GWC1_33_20]|uniref:Uncharacterized protein n=1 Tax=candidate division WS6 bacterium GW2011_GWC1_33_20 TaxID=1619089 RepID=A0A0F9ZI08_9BACT|nr:MAG: hypothetical protein UR34_C0011G0018 [candidate division WS6 bacterium GW2011_GWC1_33_20]
MEKQKKNIFTILLGYLIFAGIYLASWYLFQYLLDNNPTEGLSVYGILVFVPWAYYLWNKSDIAKWKRIFWIIIAFFFSFGLAFNVEALIYIFS